MFSYSQKKNTFYLLLFAWFCKIVAAILLGFIYQQHYQGGDTFSLFEDGKELYFLAKENFEAYLDVIFSTLLGKKSLYSQMLDNQNPRAVLMAIYNSVLVFIVGPNYWLAAMLTASMHFVIIILLIKQLEEQFYLSKLRLYAAFVFFPSVLFWSSGLLKETLLTAGLYLVIIIYLKLLNKKVHLAMLQNSIFLLILLILLGLLFRLKYYYIAVFVPLIFAHYVASKLKPFLIGIFKNEKVLFVQFAILLFLFLGSVLLATLSHPNLQLDFVLEAIVQNNEKMAAETTDATNLINYSDLNAAPISFLKNLPHAFFQGLIRPYIWEEGNIFKKWVAVENACIVLMMLFALYKVVMRKINNPHFLEIATIVLFSIVMLALLSMATPNLGTLTRYKVGFLPFLLLLILPSKSLNFIAKNDLHNR